VSILTPNQIELALLAGGDAQDDLPKLIQRLRVRDYRHDLVVTLGSQGALVNGAVDVLVPSYPVQSVDTVGAGDAFNGALAVALARRLELVDAVRYANAAGALATTRLGAQLALPSAQEIDSFINQAGI
jgi:ribokinase